MYALLLNFLIQQIQDSLKNFRLSFSTVQNFDGIFIIAGTNESKIKYK